MTKEELSILAAGAAKAVFEGMKAYIPEGFSSVGSMADDENFGRSAQIEQGRTYYIADAQFIKTQETAATKRDGSSRWIDCLEVESGVPTRIYFGTLQRNIIDATKNGFNQTPAVAKRNVGKFLKVTTFERGELKSDGSRDIKINYSVVDNI